MPKISEETREQRRQQIFVAAWRCFERNGVQGTTMEQIIAESGMAASAMYRYYKGKDDIIFAALSVALKALGAQVIPLLEKSPPPAPHELVKEVTARIEQFSKKAGFNLTRMVVEAWSEVPRNTRLQVVLNELLDDLSARLEDVERQWRAQGMVALTAPPGAIASAILTIVIGFVAHSAVVPTVRPIRLAEGLSGLLRV